MELVATTTTGLLKTPHGPLDLLAELIYDSTDPAAIYLKMAPIDEGGIHEPTTWCFGRELMDYAMASEGTVGEGDVQITVVEKSDRVRFDLKDIGGDAWPVYLELDACIDFMIAVLHSVPAEAPSMDVDDVVAKILGASA